MKLLVWLWDTRALHTLAAAAILGGWWWVFGRDLWAAWRGHRGWRETHVTASELRRIRRDYAITDEQQRDGWR